MTMENKKFISKEYLPSLKYFSEKRRDVPADYGSEMEKYRQASGLESMKFFHDTLAGELKSPGENRNLPVVGYLCNPIPEELIIACGALPVRLCSADSRCAEAGEEAVPGDICPMVKSTCGDFYNHINDNIDLLVVPATCDGKVKLAEILSPAVKEIYLLDMPRNTDYMKNIEVWTDAYTRFYEYLRDKFRARPTRNDLMDACRITNERTRIFRKIYEYRARHPLALNSFDYFILSQSSFLLNPEEWTEKAGAVYRECSSRGKIMPGDAKKILLAGSPILFPNFKILDILEETGCHAAADVMCSAYGHLYDPVEIDEETEYGILRALTLKYIAPSICPCFVGINKLINTILDAVQKYGLNGVIYCNLRLCQVFEIQTTILRNILKEKGIPLLVLKTDFSKEDTGQLKTRIEAFMEMLV